MLVGQLKLKVVLMVAIKSWRQNSSPPTTHTVSMSLVWQENSLYCHVLGNKIIRF